MAKKKTTKNKNTNVKKVIIAIVLVIVLFLALSLPHIYSTQKKVVGALEDYGFMELDLGNMYTKNVTGTYEEFGENGKTYEMLLFNMETLVLSKTHMEKISDYYVSFTGNYIFQNGVIDYSSEYTINEEEYLIQGSYDTTNKKFKCTPPDGFPIDGEEVCKSIKGYCVGLDDTVHQIFEDSLIKYLNKKAKV